jgi:hypothetical protein
MKGKPSLRNTLIDQGIAFSDDKPDPVATSHPSSTSQTSELDKELNYTHVAGSHTRLSPVVGTRADELNLVLHSMSKNPALRAFAQELYKPERIYLIQTGQRDKAEEIAEQKSSAYVRKYKAYGVTETNAVDYDVSGMPGAAINKTSVYDIENQWNTWRVQAKVETKNGTYNERGNGYLPPAVAAYHELMYVEETRKRQPDSSFDNEIGVEILATLKTVLIEDEIYKSINKIGASQVVDYQQTMNINGNSIPLGYVANFYRNLEHKYRNLAKAVTSPESLQFLSTGITPISRSQTHDQRPLRTRKACFKDDRYC